MNPELYLQRSARPDLAAHQWEKLKPRLAGTPFKDDLPTRCLLSLLGNSRFLVDRLTDEALNAFLNSRWLDRPKPRDQMLKELETLYRERFRGTLDSIQSPLRLYKYQEMTRIAARDLSGTSSFEETGKELSALASAACEIAYRAALEICKDAEGSSADARPPFVVLGLGKLGGEDLNFSSDIDLLYVHGDIPSHQISRDLFAFFCRVSETITKILHERTRDGIVFRVDLDLRPEGKSGVLVNSLEALSSYYEVSGALWERGVLTKARPVAGHYLFGQETLIQVEPFVYPASTDASAILHLKTMKEKINAELRRSAPRAGFNLKLGEGGIREIEFFVTAFQLIFGGKEPRLRERNTLKALQVIQNLGLVPAEHVAHLKDAYIFLRRAENRLQMDEERQAHALPKDDVELEALARRCGYERTEDFTGALKLHTQRVTEYFGNLAP